MIFRAALFTFIPTGVELIAVLILLSKAASPALAGSVALTFIAYVLYTAQITTLAASARKAANKTESEASGKAVDTLLNVKLTISTFV